MYILKNRAVISVSGNDCKKFLQGLLTNDVFNISTENAIFALMLTAKGRILYDFFIIEKSSNCLLLDCDLCSIDEILHRFSFYKLNHKVLLEKTEYQVYVDHSSRVSEKLYKDEINFVDPRNIKLGNRILTLNYFDSFDEKEIYEKIRINNCIVDVNLDLIKEVSFPLEYRMEYAFSFNKGCYVGQEVTARFRLKGETSKKIYTIEIISITEKLNNESDPINVFNLKIGLQIKKDGLLVGELRSFSGNIALFYCNIKILKECIDYTTNIFIADNCIIKILNKF